MLTLPEINEHHAQAVALVQMVIANQPDDDIDLETGAWNIVVHLEALAQVHPNACAESADDADRDALADMIDRIRSYETDRPETERTGGSFLRELLAA